MLEQGLKERLVGAAVLVILAVIFVPMLLDTREEKGINIQGSNIPPIPEDMPEEITQPVFKKPSSIDSPISDGRELTEDGESEPLAKDSEMTDNLRIADDVGISAWVVQVGSFASRENAEGLNNDLRKAGYRSFIEPLKKSGKTTYRVRIGPELKRSDAESIRTKVKKEFSLDGILLNYP